jgi:hypothetical protein
MSESWLLRFGAVCGVVLGMSIGVPGLVEAFTGETTVTSVIIGIGAAFGAPALTAFHLHQRRAAGRFGALAYAVNIIGLGLFAGVAFALNLVVFFLDETGVDDLMAGPTRVAVLGGALVFVVGTVLFSVSMLRAAVYPRFAALGYGGTLTLLALLAPVSDSAVTSVVHVLAAGSLGWLSASVWTAVERARTSWPSASRTAGETRTVR